MNDFLKCVKFFIVTLIIASAFVSGGQYIWRKIGNSFDNWITRIVTHTTCNHWVVEASTYTVSNDTYVVIVDTTPYVPPEPAPPVWKPPRWVSKSIPATPIEKNNARVEIKHIFSSPCEQRFGITIKNTGYSTKYADIRAILSDTNFDLKDAEIEIKRWTHTLAPARWIKANKIDEAIYKQKKYQYIGNHRIPANEVRYYEVIIRYPVQKYKDGWGGKGLLTLKVDNDEFKDTKHSSWFDDSWPYRQKITIDNSASNETLNNFPVLVHISTANCGTHFDFSTDSNTVRFIDADDSTACDFEIEYWSLSTTTGTADIHVEIPAIQSQASTDYFYMYYGASDVDNASNPEAVWDSNFVMVQHLQEDPSGSAPQMIDSTSFDHDGTSAGSMTSSDQVIGKVDGALDFDATDDEIDCGDDTYSDGFAFGNTYDDDPFTLEVIFKINSITTFQSIISKRSIADGWMEWQFGIASANNNINFIMHTGYAGRNTGDEITTDTWFYAVGTYDGSGDSHSGTDIYLNGEIADIANTGNENTNIADTPCPVYIGSIHDSNGTYRFDGIIDEIRISDIARSPDWIKATYLSLFDNFVSFGSEETSEAPPPAPTRRPNYIIIPQGL